MLMQAGNGDSAAMLWYQGPRRTRVPPAKLDRRSLWESGFLVAADGHKRGASRADPA